VLNGWRKLTEAKGKKTDELVNKRATCFWFDPIHCNSKSQSFSWWIFVMDHTESKAMMEVVTYVFGCGGCPAACFGGDDGQCDKHEQVHSRVHLVKTALMCFSLSKTWKITNFSDLRSRNSETA